MGCGKTTLGKKMAKKLQFSFVDIDSLIENKEQRSITQIFKEDGEAYFRNLESQVLKEVTEKEGDFLVSTGGGLACNQDNLDYMKQKGFVVYLHANTGVLFQRIEQSQSTRPMLKDKTSEELKLWIETLLKQREPFYEQAHLHFEAMSVSAKRLDEFQQAYQGYAEKVSN